LPTTQDAHIGFLANRQFFAFGESTPAEDLWEAHTRIVSKLSPELGMIGNFYYGTAQGNGDSVRTITRYGGDVRMIYKNMKLAFNKSYVHFRNLHTHITDLQSLKKILNHD